MTNTTKDKNHFVDLRAYIRFCGEYLRYIEDHLQAVIVSQNEKQYRFFQYGEEGGFQITRPINSLLMYDADGFSTASNEFLTILPHIKTIDKNDSCVRDLLKNATYTIQQSIGAALDALPAGKSNTARKLNGDLFERFILLILRETGVDCRSGVSRVPVVVGGETDYMNYQHDLIVKRNSEVKVIGSIKTSSKDRIDKIFMDKFLYNQLTEKATPHIAIFLNDVQRKKTRRENSYSVHSTFLSGHFKGVHRETQSARRRLLL